MFVRLWLLQKNRKSPIDDYDELIVWFRRDFNLLYTKLAKSLKTTHASMLLKS